MEISVIQASSGSSGWDQGLAFLAMRKGHIWDCFGGEAERIS